MYTQLQMWREGGREGSFIQVGSHHRQTCVGVCTENRTHQEVLVAVGVDQ